MEFSYIVVELYSFFQASFKLCTRSLCKVAISFLEFQMVYTLSIRFFVSTIGKRIVLFAMVRNHRVTIFAFDPMILIVSFHAWNDIQHSILIAINPIDAEDMSSTKDSFENNMYIIQEYLFWKRTSTWLHTTAGRIELDMICN